jgi:26S proteasome regulatory subunit N1
VEDFLGPMVTDTDTSIETASIAALALGMVFVGTAEDGCVEAILQALMMRSQAELTQPFARFLSVGLGLLYLGKQEAVEATLEVNLSQGWLALSFCWKLYTIHEDLQPSGNGSKQWIQI